MPWQLSPIEGILSPSNKMKKVFLSQIMMEKPLFFGQLTKIE